MMTSNQIQPLAKVDGLGEGDDPPGRAVAPVDGGANDPLIAAKIASLDVWVGGAGGGLATLPLLLLLETLDGGTAPEIVFKTAAFEDRFGVAGALAPFEPSLNFASFSVNRTIWPSEATVIPTLK